MTNFAPLKNDRFLRALRFEPVDTTPVWLMRQAGRYLPEYQQTRAKAGDFMALCKNTDLATEVTLQPLARYDLDAAILFSDILTIPDAMGLELSFVAGEGPKFKYTVRGETELERLPKLDIKRDLGYVLNAVTSIRKALGGRVPLIGFSGSPWTLAVYMVEGQSTRDFFEIKKMMYQRPEFLHLLLGKLAVAVTDYLCAQVEAGAQVLQIFDSWGGVLGHQEFAQFSLNYSRHIIKNLKTRHPDIPVILFTKGGGLWLDQQADTDADALGLDWTMPLDKARTLLSASQRELTLKHKKLQRPKAIQGNLDPMALYAKPAQIKAHTHAMLDLAYAHDKTGYIANLGHGITQHTHPDHARAFIDAVHEYVL